MKRLLFAIGLVAVSAMSLSAQAGDKKKLALWTCQMKAKVIVDDSFHVILKIEDLEAYGVIVCKDIYGRTSKDNVFVRLKGVGIGPGIAFPDRDDSNLEIISAKVGVTSAAGMYGRYQFFGGLGLTLFAKRIGIDRVGEFTPDESVAAGLHIQIRDMNGIGLDLTGYKMNIEPVGREQQRKAKKNKRKARNKEQPVVKYNFNN